MKKVVLCLSMFVFAILLTSMISAEFGYNNLNKPTLSKTVINYTQKNVNSSEYWGNENYADHWSGNTFQLGDAGVTGEQNILKVYADANHISMYETDSSDKEWAFGVNANDFTVTEVGVGVPFAIRDGATTNGLDLDGGVLYSRFSQNRLTGDVMVGADQAPDSELHVSGSEVTATFESDNYNIVDIKANGNDQIIRTYDGASQTSKIGIDTSDSNNLHFIVGSGGTFGTDTDMVIQADGDVGIGTATPSKKLDVYKASSDNYIQIHADNTYKSGFQLTSGAGDSYTTFDGGKLDWYVGNTAIPKASLTSTGRLGIGTTTPGYTLDVNGSSVSFHDGFYGYNFGASARGRGTQEIDTYASSSVMITNYGTVSGARWDNFDTPWAKMHSGKIAFGDVGATSFVPSHELVVIGDANITGNLEVHGNINVSGCINYNGGTLGTCI